MCDSNMNKWKPNRNCTFSENCSGNLLISCCWWWSFFFYSVCFFLSSISVSFLFCVLNQRNNSFAVLIFGQSIRHYLFWLNNIIVFTWNRNVHVCVWIVYFYRTHTHICIDIDNNKIGHWTKKKRKLPKHRTQYGYKVTHKPAHIHLQIISIICRSYVKQLQTILSITLSTYIYIYTILGTPILHGDWKYFKAIQLIKIC